MLFRLCLEDVQIPEKDNSYLFCCSLLSANWGQWYEWQVVLLMPFVEIKHLEKESRLFHRAVKTEHKRDLDPVVQ